MAFADPTHSIPENSLKDLRQEIGQFLFKTPGREDIKTIALRESFVIHQLRLEQVVAGSPSLPSNATSYAHHQVYLDGKPRAHAVVLHTDGKATIYEVVASALAERIDRAIVWIDQYAPDETPVHYLVVSGCPVYAFRLVHYDIIYVIAAPPAPVGLPNEKQLLPETILSTTEFLDRLRRLHEAIAAYGQSTEKP